jgi:hypothetical protein
MQFESAFLIFKEAYKILRTLGDCRYLCKHAAADFLRKTTAGSQV